MNNTEDEYTPTTEEIREYVEVGGEPQPWLPPDDEKDSARAAAFDRWLAERDRTTAATAWGEGAKWAAVECGSIEDETKPFLTAGDNPYEVQP